MKLVRIRGVPTVQKVNEGMALGDALGPSLTTTTTACTRVLDARVTNALAPMEARAMERPE